MVPGIEDSKKASSWPHRAHSLQSDQNQMGEAQAVVGTEEASGALGYPKEQPFLAWRWDLRNYAPGFLIPKE